MSDTTVTTQAPASNSPPPASVNETPIDTNQQSAPNAITNTAPEKPPMSRRDAIKAAFDRATAQQDGRAPNRDAKTIATPIKADAKKAAEAKPGHNNPPEATADADKPKINLKKRPSDQAASTLENPPTQPRDRGRFAPRAQAPTAEEGVVTPTGQQQQQAKPVKQLPETAPYRDPPVRMTDAAKADWHATPETVRGDIHRVQQEFGKAYAVYKGSFDAYQPIARFDKMAREHGTTLEQALVNYTSMEQKLRSDLIGGLDVIINNLGLKGANGAKIGLRDVAYHVLSQSPEQLKQVQMGNAQQAQTSQIGALHQEIAGLKQTLQQMHSHQQFAQTRSQVDQFADSHPRLDELGALIKAEVDLGFDLETAYRRAELLQPATTAAQTRDTAPQTRIPADRSISGSPGASGSNPLPRAPAKPTGRREAIANAIKRVNGGM
jgi:hypothetical protein